VLCIYQIFLRGDEDGAIQSDPPLIGGSLDDSFPFLVISDGMYVSYFAHGFGDLLISPDECISHTLDGIYLFKTKFLNFLLVF
jgi:hypothetical protein